ncbi:aminotransferase, putative [Talaromyces islandicus]|uniref:Aminotransferase, putative n=1 Tax=Talaromyces islandicus TaxID=28573 RepID=A0A0U1M5X3_TALIS|nr:aminotransferase, putative [Talaromyces islandicus]
MQNIETFELRKWAGIRRPNTRYSLAGSAPVPLTLKRLASLSSDPTRTTQVLGSLDSVPLGEPSTNLELRENIAAALFDFETSGVTAEHVFITAAGTTGANELSLQSLIQPGDHVIVQYPSYGQLLGIPNAAAKVDVSLWRMDPANGWAANIDQLRTMVEKGKTKLIVLNNPHNPTGYTLPTELRREIVKLAKNNDVWLHVDEIFRPLFHEPGSDASSFMDFTSEYSKVVVTGSTSKAWGLSGIRIGWIVSKEKSIREACSNLSGYVFGHCGALDTVIATEALSSRCNSIILQQSLAQAKTNIQLLDQFVQRNAANVAWMKPAAGATAFIQFRKGDKQPVDATDFCNKLKAHTGVLLAPGSLCFGDGPERSGECQELKGFVRWHLTGLTEVMEKGIAEIESFLRDGFDAVQVS